MGLYDNYYEKHLDLEEVPEIPSYSASTFSAIIEHDAEIREDIIERNRAKIEEARKRDRELSTIMLVMDRIESIADDFIGAIDRYTEVQACKHPITININAQDCSKDMIEHAVANVLNGTVSAMNNRNKGEGYTALEFESF